MSQYGNYPRKPKIDSIQRLYGMRFKDEVFKDQRFYDRVCDSVGFAHFNVDVRIGRIIKKSMYYRLCMWIISKLK